MVHRKLPRNAEDRLTALEREAVRNDIAAAFAFARYLVENPKALKDVRDGCEIRIVPARAVGPHRRAPRRVQMFAASTRYLPL